MNDIKFNVCPNAYCKGGSSCDVKPITEIKRKVVTEKSQQDYLQVFSSGYRVDSSHIDWNDWNGCVFVDIDSKHYYQDVREFNIDALYDGILDFLQYTYYNVFYNIHQSWSLSSYHIIFYFDVEKNEVNFKKCVQYAKDIIFECFEHLNALEIIKHKGVYDKCTISYYQGLYYNPSNRSDFGFIETEGFGHWSDIEYYELKEKYQYKANDVNEDLTNNFSYKKFTENNASIEAHHDMRMNIYMTLVAVFHDREIVDNHWRNICDKHIYCPDYTPQKLYNDAMKNGWYDKYKTYAYRVNIDLLKLFGYEFDRMFVPADFNFYEPDEIIEMEPDQHLSDIKINLKTDKINHIFAGCGFGKTTWAKELSKTKRVCFISPLRSISKDSFEDTNFIIIDEPHKDEANHIFNDTIKFEALHGRWSICTTWESFVAYEMYKGAFDYVIVDEIHTLSMYEYRLNSIKQLKHALQACNATKIIMTGTPSIEIDEFDCYKFKFIKTQPKTKCEILAYNDSYIGWICNDIKEWVKTDNNYAVIFKDTANYKDIEMLHNEGIDIQLFNSNYEDNVNELLETKDLTHKVTMISVYGQAGINIHVQNNKRVRLYILNNNALAAIQYANRIRNKECIDKVVITVRKDSISNDIKRVDFNIDYEDAEHKITVINSTIKRFDVFETANMQRIKFKYGFNADCLDKVGELISLNSENYKIYTFITRVNEYEKQMQVLYNRLIQNDFNVYFNYLTTDMKRIKETKLRRNVLGGQLAHFDTTQIKKKKDGALYIEPNKGLKKVLTGDLKETIEGLLNVLANSTIDYVSSFNNIIAKVIKDTGSITKSDIKRIYNILQINNKWNEYYDNAFIYVINDERWDDLKLTAAVTRSMYNDVSKDDWKDIADEMYGKVKEIRKTVSYVKYVDSEVAINLDNPNTINIENDDTTKMIYTYIMEQHTRGKKVGKKNAAKKIIINGVEYESKTEAMSKLNVGRRKLESMLSA